MKIKSASGRAIFTNTILLLSSFIVSAQNLNNIYGLKVIGDYNSYQRTVQLDSANLLEEIKLKIPTIILDLKYASDDNFLHEVIYTKAKAFARKPVVEALEKIQCELAKQGLGLKIFDAYRPYSVTKYFYEKTKDTVFVATPWTGSRHNRGCAVDLTLVNLRTGRELRMPTKFDTFSDKAHPDYNQLPKQLLKNREILTKIMQKYGFKVYYAEWWHYDFNGWEDFELMDLSFEQLLNTN